MAGLRIHKLYPLQRGKTPSKKQCPVYDIKLYLRVKFWDLKTFAASQIKKSDLKRWLNFENIVMN